MSQCHDHYDIIIYPLINKRFLFKKFSYQLTLISFVYLIIIHIVSFLQEFIKFPLSFIFKIFNNLFPRPFCFQHGELKAKQPSLPRPTITTRTEIPEDTSKKVNFRKYPFALVTNFCFRLGRFPLHRN